MTASSLQTPLHDWHRDHGGRMVDFAGWSMPVQYTSITEEHHATRQQATLFDVSHMGRFHLRGGGAARFLEGLLTRSVADLPPGRIRYSLVTRDDGGILDDVLVYHVRPGHEEPYWGMVVNADNRQKILDWLTDHQSSDQHLAIQDDTLTTGMIALQGPRALAIAQRVFPQTPWSSLKYYRAALLEEGQPGLVSRTGYTGEDGVEFILPSDQTRSCWERLMEAGTPEGLRPAGLGARDTLRLEAAMPLYGHELTEQITPIQAGLEFAVNLSDRTFPGADALRRAAADDQLPRRVGLRMTGRRVPRQGYRVLRDAQEDVGIVTSGTFSPTFSCPLAMAYVRPDCGRPGQPLQVDVRGQPESATVVELPFYQRLKA